MIKFKKTKGLAPDNITGKKQDIFVGASDCCVYQVYQPKLGNPKGEWEAQSIPKKHIGGFAAWLLAMGEGGFKSVDDAKAACQKHEKKSAAAQKVTPQQFFKDL